jgi:hypothetical protein
VGFNKETNNNGGNLNSRLKEDLNLFRYSVDYVRLLKNLTPEHDQLIMFGCCSAL